MAFKQHHVILVLVMHEILICILLLLLYQTYLVCFSIVGHWDHDLADHPEKERGVFEWSLGLVQSHHQKQWSN